MEATRERISTTPQHERRARTRSALVRAAGAVFADRGYHGATLDDVVLEAGVSKGALYHYFDSKQELFLALLEERLGAAVAEVEVTVTQPGSAEQRMNSAAQGFQERIGRDRRWLPLLLEFLAYGCRDERGRLAVAERFIRPARRGVVALIEAHPPKKSNAPTLSVEEFAIATAALMNGLAIERAFDGAGIRDDLAGRCLAVLSTGLDDAGTMRPPRGRRTAARTST